MRSLTSLSYGMACIKVLLLSTLMTYVFQIYNK